MDERSTTLSRREFVGGTAALASLLIVPRHVVAGSGQTPPSEKLNIAAIGVGGRGAANVKGLSGENILALCDVDEERAGGTFEMLPKAKRYRDYRKMLDDVDGQIDAVVVSTPDHTHAVALMAAIRRGKHVYSEKPLAHSIHEIRALRKAAHEHQVITQLGNQGHSYDSIRTFCEWIWDGAIGNVHTIHAVCGSSYSRIDELPQMKEQHPVPSTLDWDLWLGPAQFRPYHPAYLPGKWRGWMPFGTGAIGDWVCHVVDPVFWALDLGSPTSIEAQAKGYDPEKHGDTFPKGTVVRYDFPARGSRGPVVLYWYDGEATPPRPDELEPKRKLPRTGAIVLGDRGGLTYGSHGAGQVRIFPEKKMQAYELPEKTIPRVAGHHQDWVQAIRIGEPAGSNFDYGGPLTELALLGIIATRMAGRKLEWDGERAWFTNCEEANDMVRPPYREGWSLE